MESVTWTDERLEERFDGIDRRFDEVDRRFDEVNRKFEEVDRRFDRVEGEIVGLRRDLRVEIGGLRAEMHDLQSVLNRTGAGIIIGLVGVIAAVLLNGGA